MMKTSANSIVVTLDQLAPWAKAFTKNLAPKQVILLKGQMGTGKTQLVRSILAEAGVGEEVSSPSFAVHHRYESSVGVFDHLDFDRLVDFDDLESIGFWDLFITPPAGNQKKHWVFIEWAEKFLSAKDFAMNWQVVQIEISWVDENTRSLTIV